MMTISLLRSILRNIFKKENVDRQLEDELHSFVDMATDEKVAAGVSPSEARRIALAELGGVEQLKQAVRDHRAGTTLETVWSDVRFGWRQLLRNPGFTLAVVLTLALSVGVNTAIFSVVNALILKSLPYPEPDRLGTIFMHIQGSATFDGFNDIDGEQWELLRDSVPSVVGAVTGGMSSGVNLKSAGGVQFAHAGRISAHYFDVLGLRPALGRNFTEDDDRPHGPRAVILSYDLWRNAFHGDSSLIGKTITLKDEAHTVIGVLPQGATTPLNADLYTPLQPSRQGEGAATNFDVIVRLRDGANWQQADAEINRAWANRALRFVKDHHPGATISFYTVPLQKSGTASLGPKALTLMLAAGIILLIACANLAGLTIVRMSRRTAEIATRLALGASRWHVQRQLWIESLLLAMIGGAVGIGVGFLALRGLLTLLPLNYLPVSGVPMDGRVLSFAVIISLLTSVLFGMLPILALKGIDLRSFLGSRTIAGADRLRMRQVLIAGEVALTVVLLAATGLLVRTLIHLQTLPPGFNPNGVLTAKASMDEGRYRNPAEFDRLMRESRAAIEQIPGVQSAGVGLTVPFERALNNATEIASGPQSGQNILTGEIYVTPGYFETLQIPLLAGRSFNDSDQRNSHPVAIVNRSFIRKLFGGTNPVGLPLDKAGTIIIGVVEDVTLPPHTSNVNDPLGTEPTVYIPASQADAKFISVVHVWFQPSWIVRTRGSIEGLPQQMQRALSSVDPGLPFSGFYNMKDYQAKAIATQRIEVALLSAMAGLALLLSAVGIFALIANIVVQRTREIGIRIALGATVRQVMANVAASGIRSSAAGLVLGLLLCIGTLRAMRSVLFGVGVYDLPSIAGVVVILSVVTALAIVIPTLRIAGTDPASTLRDQ
jgi:macrolide transport system ATP-binding/permease protein